MFFFFLNDAMFYRCNVLEFLAMQFLDAIASPSSYPGRSVSESVGRKCFQISEIAIASTELASLFLYIFLKDLREYFNQCLVGL